MSRITFSTLYSTAMGGVQSNANTMNKLLQQIVSEKKVTRPSDNPVGFSTALNYKNSINSLGQQKVNINDSEAYMNTLETTLQSINNIFTRAQELAVQAASDTLNHGDRLTINLEIRQNLEQLVSLSQTQHNGGYIFSGKWTNQAPYEIKNGEAKYDAADTIALNTDPDDPRIFDSEPVTIQLYDSAFIDQNLVPQPDNPLVQCVIPGSVQLNGLVERPGGNTDLPEDHPDYGQPDYEIDYVNGTITLLSDRAKAMFYDDTGDVKPNDQMPNMSFEYIYRNSIDMSGEIYREIDTGVTIKINSNPDDVFGGGGENDTNAFKEMITLMQGLWYNDQPTINEGIDAVDTARERNLVQQSLTGAKQNRIELVLDRNLELTTTNTEAVGNIEDTDLTEALYKISLAEVVYNASLQAASMMLNRTLADYL